MLSHDGSTGIIRYVACMAHVAVLRRTPRRWLNKLIRLTIQFNSSVVPSNEYDWTTYTYTYIVWNVELYRLLFVNITNTYTWSETESERKKYIMWKTCGKISKHQSYECLLDSLYGFRFNELLPIAQLASTNECDFEYGDERCDEETKWRIQSSAHIVR